MEFPTWIGPGAELALGLAIIGVSLIGLRRDWLRLRGLRQDGAANPAPTQATATPSVWWRWLWDKRLVGNLLLLAVAIFLACSGIAAIAW